MLQGQPIAKSLPPNFLIVYQQIAHRVLEAVRELYRLPGCVNYLIWCIVDPISLPEIFIGYILSVNAEQFPILDVKQILEQVDGIARVPRNLPSRPYFCARDIILSTT